MSESYTVSITDETERKTQATEEYYHPSNDPPIKFGPILILGAAFLLWGSSVLAGAWLVTTILKFGEHACPGVMS